MQPTTTSLVRRVAFQTVVMALLFATAMTVCVWLTSANPHSDTPQHAFQIVLLVLNLPACLVLFFMFMSGPEHGDALKEIAPVLFPVLVFIQWFVIGCMIGLVKVVVAKLRKPNM